MTVIEDTCRCGARLRVEERNEAFAALKHVTWLNAHAICRRTSADTKDGQD